MESPYAPRRRRQGEEPTPKSSFQRELDAKMRDRRSRGLTTEVTESEGELGSDDELMAHFNMTNKPQPSPRGKDRGEGEGRKSPWAPPGTQKQHSTYDDPGHQGNRRSPHEESAAYGSRRASQEDRQEDRLPYATSGKKSPYNDSSAPYGSSNRQSPFDTSARRSPGTKANSPTGVIFGKKNKDADRDGMLKTMKRPGGWKSPASATHLRGRSRDGSEDDVSDDGSDEIESVSRQKNRPMSAMRRPRDPHPHEEDKENWKRNQSPGRKTPTFRDSEDYPDERPYPTPRSRSSSRTGTERDAGRDAEPLRPRPKPRTGKEADRDADRDASWSQRTSGTAGGKKSRSGTPKYDGDDRKTPTERRKSPFGTTVGEPALKPKKRTNHSDPQSDDDRKSPFKPVPRGRKGSVKEAKDLHDDSRGRKSPYGDKANSRYGPESFNRKSPFDEKSFRKQRTQSGDLDDEMSRTTRSKSPNDRKSPATNRKSPLDFKGGKHDAKGRKSPYGSQGYGDGDMDKNKSSNGRTQQSSWRDEELDNRSTKGRRKPWQEEEEADDRRTKERRKPWQEEEEGDDRRTKGHRKPWQEEEEEDNRRIKGHRKPWQEEEADDRRTKGHGKPWQKEKEEDNRRTNSHRKPWQEEEEEDKRRTNGQRKPWQKEEEEDKRRTKGRKSPWEEELDKKDRRDEKDGSRRRSFGVEDEKVKRGTENKVYSSGSRSPWEKDDRPGYRGKERRDDEDDDDDDDEENNDWRRDRKPKRGESGDRKEYQGSRDRPPLQRSPAAGTVHRRKGSREDNDYDESYPRGRSDDRDGKYRDRYDDGDSYRYEQNPDDIGDGHYPHRHQDGRNGDRDDERYGRERHEDDKNRKPKQRKDQSNRKTNEQESSICGDVDLDPTMRPPQTKEGKEIEKKQPRHQRKEKQMLDNAIDTIKDAQHRSASAGDQKMRYIDPAKEPAEKATRPQSSHTPRLKPKPRYAKPNMTLTGMSNFENTLNIRDSVYQQWYAEHMETARREKQEKLRKEQEEEEKKKKDKEDKFFGAKASYNSWLETKKSRLHQEKRKKVQLEAKEKKEEQEKKEDKQKGAEVTFRRWKEDKDIVLKEKAREKKKEEEELLKEKQDKEIEQRKDAEKVFKGWKSTKDEILVKKAREMQEEEHQKVRRESKQKRRREKVAHSSYNEWLEKKETQIQNEANTHNFGDEEEWKPAWKPNTSTIPFGH